VNQTWNGPEHCQVFKSHLRWTIFTDRDTGMRSYTVNVSLGNGSHTQLNKLYKCEVFIICPWNRFCSCIPDQKREWRKRQKWKQMERYDHGNQLQ